MGWFSAGRVISIRWIFGSVMLSSIVLSSTGRIRSRINDGKVVVVERCLGCCYLSVTVIAYYY